MKSTAPTPSSAEIAKRYGVSDVVVNAIAAHHGEVEPSPSRPSLWRRRITFRRPSRRPP
ncbi:MAG: hypothetical protein R3A10_07015 [Caldilineaceae bacterium]